MKTNENKTYEEKMKQGCLFPLYAMLLATILSLILMFALNCKGRKSQDAIDDSQLSEMVDYHRSQGREIIVFE